ncbi:hypothetical protein KY360_06395 [Candidatus Woesearchaeota archaeon]|nr:hypothetical protein [Candidatus Woesearchaeota archaeon]
MYRRIVAEYIEDELKKGKTIVQVRKRLTKVGYDKKDLNEVLRTFEYREGDLKNREVKLETTKTRLNVLFVVSLAIIVMNAAFFFYYAYSQDMSFGGIPTGLTIANTTVEEPQPLEKNLSISNSSLEGTGGNREIEEIKLGYYS